MNDAMDLLEPHIREMCFVGATKSAKKVECPTCGEYVEALVREQGHEMCPECARFVRISKTKLPPIL